MDTALTIINVVLVVLGSAVTVLAFIAPMTSSTADNKVLDALRWLEDKIRSLLGIFTGGSKAKSPPDGVA